MWWLLLGLVCVLFAGMAVVVWRKWVAPWQQIEQLVARIRDRQRPSIYAAAAEDIRHQAAATTA